MANNKESSDQLKALQVDLSPEQADLVKKITGFIQKNLEAGNHAVFTIQGEAGTGKSVVLGHLFVKLQQLARQEGTVFSKTINVFLVNHPEVLKVYQELANQYSFIFKKNFQRPTTFINQAEKAKRVDDVVLIDEAHLLLSEPDHYNNYYGQNQLADILDHARVVVLVFDSNQVIKTKAFWTRQMIAKTTAGCVREDYQLKKQFRMQAPRVLEEWIDAFAQEQKLEPLDMRAANNKYEFRFFDDAEKMYQLLRKRDKQFGKARIAATISYPRKKKVKRNYVVDGDFCLPWDKYNYSPVPWAEIPSTVNEVASIHTLQGFDLNYIGILIGPGVKLDPENPNRLLVDPAKMTYKSMYYKRADLTGPDLDLATKRLFLNALSVLMKRGRRGLYLFVHDKQLRERIEDLLED